MTNPSEFSPLGPDAPKEDRIDTALLAMGAGAAGAVVWFAVLTLIQTHLLTQSTVKSVSEIDPHSFDVNFLIYGALLGVAFAAVVAWTLMFSIPSSYRRGGLSLVAAFGGTVLAGILTYVGRATGGVSMLAAIAIFFALLGIWLGRRAVVTSV